MKNASKIPLQTPVRENSESHWGTTSLCARWAAVQIHFRGGTRCVEWNDVKLLCSRFLCVCVSVQDPEQWRHTMRFLSITLCGCFCPGWEFTVILSVMSLNLKTLQSQELFFFFLSFPFSWGTCFWLLRHLLFPWRGSGAYYSSLICPAIIKSREAVTDWPDSDIISEDA